MEQKTRRAIALLVASGVLAVTGVYLWMQAHRESFWRFPQFPPDHRRAWIMFALAFIALVWSVVLFVSAFSQRRARVRVDSGPRRL